MTEPRVLLYDLENSPALGYFWPGQLYERDILEVVQDWSILSVAWKWLGEKEVHCVGLDDFLGYVPGDLSDDQLTGHIQDLFNEAEVLVAHNGDGFDQPKVYTKLIEHGYLPPNPAQTVDTLKVARKYFKFNSNKLDEVGRVLGYGGKKASGGWSTWKGCMEGDPKAWARMKRYNKADVVLLEKVYLRLRPWIRNHPHVALIGETPAGCPNCGVPDKMIPRGYRTIRTAVKRRYQCGSCGHYSEARLPEKDWPKPHFVG